MKWFWRVHRRKQGGGLRVRGLERRHQLLDQPGLQPRLDLVLRMRRPEERQSRRGVGRTAADVEPTPPPPPPPPQRTGRCVAVDC